MSPVPPKDLCFPKITSSINYCSTWLSPREGEQVHRSAWWKMDQRWIEALTDRFGAFSCRSSNSREAVAPATPALMCMACKCLPNHCEFDSQMIVSIPEGQERRWLWKTPHSQPLTADRQVRLGFLLKGTNSDFDPFPKFAARSITEPFVVSR